jgi:hypothetical protein
VSQEESFAVSRGVPGMGILQRVLRTDERGDVPGWVLVAVMTAGLVTTLWVAADDQLTAMLQQAIESVSK